MSIEFNNIKSQWAEQSISKAPSVFELEEMAGKQEKKSKRSLYAGLVSIVSSAIFMGILLILLPKHSPMLLLGFGLVGCSFIASLLYFTRVLKKWAEVPDVTDSTNEYLAALINVESEQSKNQNRLISLFLILLFVGMCFVMAEFAPMLPIIFAIIFYSFTIFWFGMNWFYLKPKIIKKEQESLQRLIETMQSMSTE